MADVPSRHSTNITQEIARRVPGLWTEDRRDSVAQLLDAAFEPADTLVGNLERFLKDTRIDLGGTRRSLENTISHYRRIRPAEASNG